MPRTPRNLLAIGDVHGDVGALERLLDRIDGTSVQAIAVVGDLTAEEQPSEEALRRIFRALGEAGTTTVWVPGRHDSPLQAYLRESHAIEVVHPFLHGVHQTVALIHGSLLVAGFGGEVVDEAETVREEASFLRYPGWEAEYRLKVLREFDEYHKLFLFATPVAHKGLGRRGSEVLAELVKTYAPRVVVAPAEEPGQAWLGTSLVVNPGSLCRGQYAVVDLREMSVVHQSLEPVGR
jgi:Icc-related predicted phosphoesterase